MRHDSRPLQRTTLTDSPRTMPKNRKTSIEGAVKRLTDLVGTTVIAILIQIPVLSNEVQCK